MELIIETEDYFQEVLDINPTIEGPSTLAMAIYQDRPIALAGPT